MVLSFEEKYLNLKKNIFLSGIILIFYLFFNSIYNNHINFTVLHFFYVIVFFIMVSGSMYTNIFNEKHLLFIIIIQFSLAFIQNVLCNIGYSSFIESFGTHPSKINEGEYYNISQWFPGFFRVHGGFKESSQFAVFCCLLLFITKSKIIHLISILSIFLTGSISGFLGLLFFCLYKLKSFIFKDFNFCFNYYYIDTSI